MPNKRRRSRKCGGTVSGSKAFTRHRGAWVDSPKRKPNAKDLSQLLQREMSSCSPPAEVRLEGDGSGGCEDGYVASGAAESSPSPPPALGGRVAFLEERMVEIDRCMRSIVPHLSAVNATLRRIAEIPVEVRPAGRVSRRLPKVNDDSFQVSRTRSLQGIASSSVTLQRLSEAPDARTCDSSYASVRRTPEASASASASASHEPHALSSSGSNTSSRSGVRQSTTGCSTAPLTVCIPRQSSPHQHLHHEHQQQRHVQMQMNAPKCPSFFGSPSGAVYGLSQSMTQGAVFAATGPLPGRGVVVGGGSGMVSAGPAHKDFMTMRRDMTQYGAYVFPPSAAAPTLNAPSPAKSTQHSTQPPPTYYHRSSPFKGQEKGISCMGGGGVGGGGGGGGGSSNGTGACVPPASFLAAQHPAATAGPMSWSPSQTMAAQSLPALYPRKRLRRDTGGGAARGGGGVCSHGSGVSPDERTWVCGGGSGVGLGGAPGRARPRGAYANARRQYVQRSPQDARRPVAVVHQRSTWAQLRAQHASGERDVYGGVGVLRGAGRGGCSVRGGGGVSARCNRGGSGGGGGGGGGQGGRGDSESRSALHRLSERVPCGAAFGVGRSVGGESAGGQGRRRRGRGGFGGGRGPLPGGSRGSSVGARARPGVDSSSASAGRGVVVVGSTVAIHDGASWVGAGGRGDGSPESRGVGTTPAAAQHRREQHPGRLHPERRNPGVGGMRGVAGSGRGPKGRQRSSPSVYSPSGCSPSSCSPSGCSPSSRSPSSRSPSSRSPSSRSPSRRSPSSRSPSRRSPSSRSPSRRIPSRSFSPSPSRGERPGASRQRVNLSSRRGNFTFTGSRGPHGVSRSGPQSRSPSLQAELGVRPRANPRGRRPGWGSSSAFGSSSGQIFAKNVPHAQRPFTFTLAPFVAPFAARSATTGTYVSSQRSPHSWRHTSHARQVTHSLVHSRRRAR